jgi:hypothetical protein
MPLAYHNIARFPAIALAPARAVYMWDIISGKA